MDDGQPIDDVVLLEAWSQGDRASGTALFERHYLSIERFFGTKVKEAACEDLIHETFLTCLKNPERCRGQAGFRIYLFRIAYSVLRDHLQRLPTDLQWWLPTMDLEALPATSFQLSPIAITEQDNEQELLLKCLSRIPLRNQIPLELYDWEKLTVVEVSEVLEIPLGTVKERLRDGRVYLEDQLLKLAQAFEPGGKVFTIRR